MKKEKYSTQYLLDKNLTPYALTMTFTQSKEEYGTYSDSLLYSNKQWINTDISTQRKIDYRSQQMITSFRYGINNWMSELLDTSNITRNRYLYQTPIIHYHLELMERNSRYDQLGKCKGSFSICPLHIHGIIFVQPNMIERFEYYLGDNTLTHFKKNILSSRIEKVTCIDGWVSYIRKQSDSYYFAFGDMYPVAYKQNPESFIETVAKQINSQPRILY